MSIRNDFPILSRQVGKAPLVYLDNAATTQKPEIVLQTMDHYYRHYNANVHRAAHRLADEATAALEEARSRIANFINAKEAAEVVFTRGTTEAINLVCHGLTQDPASPLGAGDEIVVTIAEHHANFVPWRLAADRSGAVLRIADIASNGDVDLDSFQSCLNERTKIVAFGHVSNALGTVNPIEEMISMVRAASPAKIVVDGAQAVLHLPIDVQTLDADFYAFSSHKMFGPTGVGVLWGKAALLEAMPPYQTGGEMIEHVSVDEVRFNKIPHKFEAGTPDIAGIIGLGAAVSYLESTPRMALKAEEDALLDQLLIGLRELNGVRLIGEPTNRLAVVSFLVEGGHPGDIGTLLDQQGVAVRTGHHCAMPLMQRLEVPGTVRASLSLYNNADDVDALLAGIRKALTFL